MWIIERLMNFIDLILDQSNLDEEEGKIILGRKANTKDVEKAFILITGILEEKGFGLAVDRWRERVMKSKAK